MKNFSFTSLFLFVFLNVSLAQTFPYILVTETDSYNELTEAIELTSVGDLWDDPEFAAPINFDFEFLGTSSDSVFFGLGLGSILSFVEDFNQDVDLLIPYIDDLTDIENVDPNTQSTIKYTTEGDIGSQIFKLEWKDCGFFNEIDGNATAENIVSFQMWLYESDNSIEFRFGPSTIVNPNIIHDFTAPSAGIMEKFNYDTELFETYWNIAGDAANPSIMETDTSFFSNYTLTGLTPHPENGQVYRLVDIETNINDITQSLEIKIYPNLVQEDLTVKIDESILNTKTQFFITNQMGQIIKNNTITKNGERINVENFSAGIYFLTVFNKNGKITKKFIKQ